MEIRSSATASQSATAGWAAFCVRRAQCCAALPYRLPAEPVDRHPGFTIARSLNDIRSPRLQKSPPWRQADLAWRVGCTQGVISASEGGRVVPDLAKAIEIATALGVRVEQVFFELVDRASSRPPRVAPRGWRARMTARGR
ncbi:MAG: helix-turn-helix transcriptional regulator [Myxococcota bacterium]